MERTAPDLWESGAVAHVNFRVRCETLSHGEEVFLVVMEGSSTPLHQSVGLYTTPSEYPWYHTLYPITLSLPPTNTATGSATAAAVAAAAAAASTATSHKPCFRYRYAIHRAGVFHRWEQPSDGGTDHIIPVSSDSNQPQSLLLLPGEDDVTMDEQQVFQHCQETDSAIMRHEIPLHLMQNRESYTVYDVLGITTGPPRVEHIRSRGTATDSAATAIYYDETLAAATTAGGGGGSALTNAQPENTPATLPISALHSTSTVTTPANTTATIPTAINNKTTGPTRKKVGFAPTQPVGANYYQTPDHHPQQQQQHGPKSTVHLNSTDGLVVVSVFLPVILHRNDADGKWTADWDYEMLLSMQTHLRVTRVGVVKWRGWHGNTGHTGSPEAGVPRHERHLVEECLLPFHCVPVWIDPTLFGEMYNGFCKGVLWPVLHNVTSVYSNRPEDNDLFKHAIATETTGDGAQFSEYSLDDLEQGPIHGGRGREAELWGAYTSVNRQFAERVVQCFHEGDLVWIHGFHLLILPSYLTRRIPMAKVGIFLHTPFPSSEIFRTLWCREDLLRGMLNADQVGFHLFEYARHFLTSCRRLLGLNYGMIPDASGGHTLAIETAGRHVAVTSIHAGVEPPVLKQVLMHSTTMDNVMQIRSQYPNKLLFCAVDRLESLKGIPLKLLGLERFLNRCPEYAGKVVLIQVGIRAHERRDDFIRTESEIRVLSEKINSQWPGAVRISVLNEQEMKLPQRMALLRAGDVCVVSSIRDGLNLLPLEFTMAHQDALTEMGRRDGRRRGLCILSEFSSCTRVMRGALHVNPYKISEIANAFYVAANMKDEERLRRLSIASEFVTRVTTQRWALAVMLDLKGIHKNINPVQFSGAGLGLGYRLLGMDTGFTSLDANVVAKAYKNSKARLILLDYGGTIVNNDNLDNLVRFQMVKERKGVSLPTPNMIAALKELCSDKRNTVFVVSGKERHSLTETLGGIPNLGLAAEHGMFISWPTAKPHHKRRWETLVPETDRTWRSLAVTIMEVYTSRTHGSYIEETEMKVLWQYRDADTEFGSLQAKELEDHLSKYLRSFPVDVLHGGIKEGGYVEVRPKGVNKGVLAMRAIKRFPDIAQKSVIDFSLVLGDDHCDEPMLSVMRQIGRRVKEAKKVPLTPMPATIQLVDVSPCDNYVSPDLEVFTCTVGKKPSAAAHYVNDVDEAQELLESLVKISTRDRRHYSSVDLASISKSPQGVMMDDSRLVKPVMVKSQSLSQMGQQPEKPASELSEEAPSKTWKASFGLAPMEDNDEEDDIWF